MYKCLFLAAILALTGCASTGSTASGQGRPGMANPASVYCLKLGGVLSQVRDARGESNNCKLPGGEIIDEWALFHRDHPQPAS